LFYFALLSAVFLPVHAADQHRQVLTVSEACEICMELDEGEYTTETYLVRATVFGVNHANKGIGGLLNLELTDNKQFLYSYHQASVDSLEYRIDEMPNHGDTLLVCTRLEKFKGGACAYYGYVVEQHPYIDPAIRIREQAYELELARQHERFMKMALATVVFFLLVLVVFIWFYFRRMHHENTHDFLTGVLNRHGGTDTILSIQRRRRPGYLGILDVDKFKEVNDTFGHKTGDDLLCRVAQLLCVHFGKDTVMRMGGDEFAFFDDESQSEQEFRRRVDEFFSSVKGIRLDHAPVYRPSVSMGAVLYDGNPTTTFDELYSFADQALYESKRHEGNELTIH